MDDSCPDLNAESDLRWCVAGDGRMRSSVRGQAVLRICRDCFADEVDGQTEGGACNYHTTRRGAAKPMVARPTRAGRKCVGWNWEEIPIRLQTLGGNSYVADVFENADDAIAKVQDDIRRAQWRAERIPDLQAATARTRGLATSEAEDLRVEIDHTGAVTSLHIDDQALSRGGSALAAELVQLMGQARTELRRKLLESAVELLGDDDPIVSTYRDTLQAEVDSAESAGDDVR